MIGNLDGIDNDYISGWAIDPDNPTARIPLEVYYNGALLTGAVAGFPRADLVKAGVGDGHNGFYVGLPALHDQEQAEVLVRFADTGQMVGEPRRLLRRPHCTPRGVLAADILRLQELPLHSVQGLTFNGDSLVIAGAHLPPGGNPFDLRVVSTPGVVFSVDAPLFMQNLHDWYWYWPNAGWSGYRITVDLASSTAEGAEFEFTFEAPREPAAYSVAGRNKVYVPKDIQVFQRFPGGDQLTRVQRFDSSGRVAFNGYRDYRVMIEVARQYDVDLAAATVLDWGCGHGRMIRHFAQHGVVKQTWAVDIDRENVGWLAGNFPGIEARTVPLLPPTDLPEHHFDFIYGVSVMTHLTEPVQHAWLTEIRRIAKPGAIVALTIAGPSATAFASRFLSPEWLTNWLSAGFDDTDLSTDLAGKIDDDDYYRNTKQSHEWTRDAWGKHFEILDIHPCVFGYQDLVVMRA